MERILNFFLFPIKFCDWKKKRLDNLAQEFAKLLMFLCFKINENIKIRSYFHLLMFFIFDGDKICSILPEILDFPDTSDPNPKNLKYLDTVFDLVIHPMLIKNKNIDSIMKIDTNSDCQINPKYIETIESLKRPIVGISRPRKELGGNTIGGTNNLSLRGWYQLATSLTTYNPKCSLLHVLITKCDDELLILIAKYFKKNYEEALNEYNEYENFLISYSVENIKNMENEKERLILELIESAGSEKSNKNNFELVKKIGELDNFIKQKPIIKMPLFDKNQLEIILHNYNVFLSATECVDRANITNASETTNVTNETKNIIFDSK